MAKFLRLVGGLPIMADETVAGDPYLESIYYSSGLAANTNITLPNSGSFSDANAKDLIVILNDTIKETTRDFDVVGSGPFFNQIKFIYDLPDDSVVVFRKNV